MNNQEAFKTLFNQKLNQEIIKQNILNTKPKVNYLKLITIPTCIILLFISIITIIPKYFPKTSIDFPNTNNIYINQLTELKFQDMNVYSKELSAPEYYNHYLAREFTIPSYLTNTKYFTIHSLTDDTNCHTDNTPTSLSDILKYQLIYSNDKSQSIIISYSLDNYPVHDYIITYEYQKPSHINGFNLIIYSYQNKYLTSFKYQDIYYDIETENISENDFINFLKSIIK